MKEIVQVLVVLVLGVWIGFICGMGSAFGKIEKLAEYKRCCIDPDLYVETPYEDEWYRIKCNNCGNYPSATLYRFWSDADEAITAASS